MTRAEAIRAFLAGRKTPATIGEIQIGLEEQRLAERVDRDKFASRINAQVSQLLKAGKVVRTGLLGSYHYALAPDGTVDRRLKPATVRSTERKRRKADKPLQRERPMRGPVLVSTYSLQPAPSRLTAADEVAKDVAAFLARGGAIERLSPGESAKPTRAWLEANGRLKPRKAPKRKTQTADVDEPDDAVA